MERLKDGARETVRVCEAVEGPEGDLKTCRECARTKPHSEFYKHPTNSDRLLFECKACRRASAIRFRVGQTAEQKRRDPSERLRDNLKQKYGLTVEAYEAMVERQAGLCAICNHPNRLNRRLVVDHCHTTGKVRALLCDPCNQGLGHFRDNQARIAAAGAYLRLHQ